MLKAIHRKTEALNSFVGWDETAERAEVPRFPEIARDRAEIGPRSSRDRAEIARAERRDRAEIARGPPRSRELSAEIASRPVRLALRDRVRGAAKRGPAAAAAAAAAVVGV